MEYEVREIKERRKFIGFGVYAYGGTEPKATFKVPQYSEQVAHHLACQLANDMSVGIE